MEFSQLKTTTRLPNNSLNNNDFFSGIILGLTGVSCGLSIFGACFIFYTFWFIPEIRNFTRKLIVSLTAADLISAIGYLMSVLRYAIDKEGDYKYNAPSNIVCTFQSIVTTYSSIVSFLLTSLISLHLMIIVNHPGYLKRTVNWTVAFNVIGWTVPCIVTIIAIADDALGEDTQHTGATGPWCWVKSKHIVWMFVAGKGWEISCYLLSTMLYMCMKYNHYKQNRRIRFPALDSDLREDDKNFLYVFFVLYIIRIWGTIRFFMLVADTDSAVENQFMAFLLYMQAIGDPAQAFCNFILFCICDNQVRRKVVDRLCGENENEDEPFNERRALIHTAAL